MATAVEENILESLREAAPEQQQQQQQQSTATTTLADDGTAKNPGQSRRLVFGLAVGLAIVLAVVIIAKMSQMSTRSLDHDLKKKGWLLYTKKGCGWCSKQLNLLGGRYPAEIECENGVQVGGKGTPVMACKDVGAFPFWYNTKTEETRKGLQDLAALGKMAAQ